MKKKILLSLLLISVLFAGCHTWGIKGNGNVIVEERDISNVDKISVSGIFYVKLIAGEDYSLKVRAEENLINFIRTEEQQGTLVISSSKRLSPKKKMQILVTLPEIKSIESSGVNKVYAKNIQSERLTVDLSGAGYIRLSGEVGKFTADVSGASKLEAGDLICKSAAVDVSGASHAVVFADENLVVDASGASKVKYLGEPKNIVTDVSGVSSIKRIAKN